MDFAELNPGGELGFWTEEQFINTLRTGVTPGGHELNENMPWQGYRLFYDDELKAIFMYLQSLPEAGAVYGIILSLRGANGGGDEAISNMTRRLLRRRSAPPQDDVGYSGSNLAVK
ncbi:MAG: hypothetical protein M0C28_29900 [Candidatus Moduliflexus flocculans]|nr:hypothetical protein [Candidatus Moduliflexus flocculans]